MSAAEVQRAPSALRVELLTVYSKHADRGRKLRRLPELPVRRGDEPLRRPVDVRRRPTRAEIAATYEAGANLQQIATRFGMHCDTISAALARAAVERRYHQTVPVDLKQAAELIATGYTITETAAAMGIGRTTLVKARRNSRG